MDKLTLVSDTITSILSQLGFSDQVSVQSQHDETNDTYEVFLQTKDPALLIGYHGETLSALQFILGQHVHSNLGSWLNLTINVNDYRERRKSALEALADSAVQRVVTTGQPHSLPPMPAGERRLVHMYLADHPQVVTASEGLGRTRSIVVSPKA